MNFYRTELLHAALAEELADRFAAEITQQYGDAVAMLAARNPDNMDAFAEAARKVVQLVPESKIDELFDANVDAIDWLLEQQYMLACPERAAAQLVARRLIRSKEVSHVAPVC